MFAKTTGIANPALQSAESSQVIQSIKNGIWLYFFLLIFEGGLRKWVLPGLATPLLVVRDPVAVWLLFMAIKNKIMPLSISLIGIVVISLISLFFTLFVGHGNVMVMLYGLRIFVIHFPVIFVIGAVFNRKDVIQMGKVVLWLCIPMTLLVAMQFYSPQSAWVNIGVGGEGSAGFSGALGYARPPGTFAFTNGNTLFYAMVANFICYFLISTTKEVQQRLLYVSALCLIIAIPLAISRTLVFQTVVFICFSLVTTLNKPKQFRNMLITIFSVLFVFIGLSQMAFFDTSITVFMARFDSASGMEGGLEGVLVDRYLGGMISSLNTGGDMPFWGHGLGLGTNVGSQLLTGSISYLISEGEWGRIIGEFGAFLGLLVIAFRLELALEITIKCARKMQNGDSLPFILLANCLLILPQGQWAQPTALGFAVVSTGITFASLKK